MLATTIGLAAVAAALSATQGDTAADKKQLEQLNMSWLKSLETRDETAMGSVLADDFIGLYGDVALSKHQMLEGLKTRPETRVSWENLKIEVKGDSAVVSAISTIWTRRDNHEATNRFNYADFYSRRNGEWKAISARVIRLP